MKILLGDVKRKPVKHYRGPAGRGQGAPDRVREGFARPRKRGVVSLPPVLCDGPSERLMTQLSEKVMNLPAVPGVYLFKNPAGRVLYVGKAKSLAHRVRNYLAPDFEDPRLRELMAQAADLDTVLTDTEAEALLLEATLIRQYQ